MNKVVKIILGAAFGIAFLGKSPNFKKQNNVLSNDTIVTNSFIKRHYVPNSPFAPEPTSNEGLTMNSSKEYTMKKGKVYKFKYTALSTGFVVFEASSDVSTDLFVSRNTGKSIYDVGGERGDSNAKIRIKLTAGSLVYVYARISDSFSNPSKATVKLSVRKPTVSILATNYLHSWFENDFENDTYCVTKFLNDGLLRIKKEYSVDIHAGIDAQTALNNNLFKNDVLVFNGYVNDHKKYQHELYFDDYDGNGEYNGAALFPNELDFHGTSLAVWLGYGSAKDGDEYCIAKQAYENGAKCSIGLRYIEGLSEDWTRNYVCRLLNCLSEPGITVAQAVDEANEFINPGLAGDTEWYLDPESFTDAINWYINGPVKIYGNKDLVLVGDTDSNGIFSLSDSNPLLPPIGMDKINFK